MTTTTRKRSGFAVRTPAHGMRHRGTLLAMSRTHDRAVSPGVLGARHRSTASARWLASAAALVLVPLAALSGCGAASSAAAAERQPAPAGRDGALISAKLIARLSERNVATELRNARLAPGDPALGARAVRYGVIAYRVLYRTVTASGRPTRASGLVVFPAGRSRELRVIDYGHGTTAFRADVPSSFGLDASGDGIEGRWSAELFASAGFAVAEPDYVGMGSGPGRPEYMVAKSEASASLDLLRAAEVIAQRRGDRLAPGVLATGFSEGGSAAMALGRALQQAAEPRLRLRALAPISGPYDLIGAQLPGMFNGQVGAGVAPYYAAYTLTAWNPLYHLYAAPADAFRPPYAASVEGLFDGSHRDAQIFVSLPPSLRDLLTTRYLRIARHPAGAFRRALIRNGTCTGWTPQAPVRLYAARGDGTVPQANSLHCQQAIGAHGGHARLIQLGAVSHDVSDFLALPQIVDWFRSLN